jgi:hypothetical protein
MFATTIILTFFLFRAVLRYKNSKAPPKQVQNNEKQDLETIILKPQANTDANFVTNEMQCVFAWKIETTNDNSKGFTTTRL